MNEMEVPTKALNTSEESSKILALLNKYNISPAFFAKTKLCTTNVELDRLVESPVPWTSLSDRDKKQFARIHTWTSYKSSEWEELKQCFDRFRARKAEQDMLYRKSHAKKHSSKK
jgi:hypothetical protein